VLQRRPDGASSAERSRRRRNVRGKKIGLGTGGDKKTKKDVCHLNSRGSIVEGWADLRERRWRRLCVPLSATRKKKRKKKSAHKKPELRDSWHNQELIEPPNSLKGSAWTKKPRKKVSLGEQPNPFQLKEAKKLGGNTRKGKVDYKKVVQLGASCCNEKKKRVKGKRYRGGRRGKFKEMGGDERRSACEGRKGPYGEMDARTFARLLRHQVSEERKHAAEERE